MMITNINPGDNISFKSGYPTFGSCGHLRHTNVNPLYENTNPFYRPLPPKGGILYKEHAANLGNKLDVLA